MAILSKEGVKILLEEKMMFLGLIHQAHQKPIFDRCKGDTVTLH
jgi:hypothetical protein